MSIKNIFVVIAGAAVAGCATTSEQDVAPAEDAAAYCALDDDALHTLQERALAFVIEEWPVLDAECEQMSDKVLHIYPDSCAIAGGPKRTDECPEPVHEGYNVVFDKDTLEPVNVYFKVK
jgi:hypothetical protein